MTPPTPISGDEIKHILGHCFCIGEAERVCWYEIHYQKAEKFADLDTDQINGYMDKWQEEAIDSYVAQEVAKSEYDSRVAGNCRMVANARDPGEWVDPTTGKKLYNQEYLKRATELTNPKGGIL